MTDMSPDSGETEAAIATALVEPLARFLLEHDQCGDDYWTEASEQRRNFYRTLADDVLVFLVALNVGGSSRATKLPQRCGPCQMEDHAHCTRAESGVFPAPGGFAIHCCCVDLSPSGKAHDDVPPSPFDTLENY